MAEEERRNAAPLRMNGARLIRELRAFVVSFVLGLIAATGIIYLIQDGMIYHPQSYSANAEARKQGDRPLVKLPYRTSSGDEVAFYIAPKDGGTPKRLWMMFGGNGGLILQYREGLPVQNALQDDGFLLVDYPGYGYDQGRPSGASIQENANAALETLAKRSSLDPDALLARTGVVGHSLGTGVALEFAQAHPQVQRIVLVAPFTSLYDMAFRVVGPIARLLHHNYANAAVLAELGKRTPRPQVVIVTGDSDQVIPIDMSRKLAHDNPWLAYREMPGLEHNRIVDAAAPQIAAVMAAMK